ncbi:CrcB family protein [Pediococcus argentinicus]|uniref:fluoride efflux transporter FluC n=1 Tax=Pediococcus argentinicus TaxID=480391 RepID=UPI00339047B3
MVKRSLSVAIFAFIGGIARLFLQNISNNILGQTLTATILINILGAFLLGMLSGGLLTRFSPSEPLNVGITTGLMGGFTTFSSFELDTDKTLIAHHLGISGMYFVGTILIGIIFAVIGRKIGEYILSKGADWE